MHSDCPHSRSDCPGGFPCPIHSRSCIRYSPGRTPTRRDAPAEQAPELPLVQLIADLDGVCPRCGETFLVDAHLRRTPEGHVRTHLLCRGCGEKIGLQLEADGRVSVHAI